jgi:membrane-associated phospholipid phosphatase
MTLVANIIFVAYPTTVVRPPIEGNSIIDLIARFIFWIDTPILNCFPSLHCAISMLWILFTYNLKNTNIYFKLFVFIMSVTIMASTLILKQHVFIDLVSGDIIATCIYFIIIKDNKLTNKFKKLLKI